MRLISTGFVQARKTYPCDACAAWIGSEFSWRDCSKDEQLILDAAQADKFKIRAGQVYFRVVRADDDGLHTFRYRPGMYRLIDAFGFFDE